MIHKRFSFKMSVSFFVFAFLFVLSASPVHAYDVKGWTVDGYVKSQFGLFTEGKPFNKAQYGGSNDNIATARQQVRWNVNGFLTSKIGIRAEVLAAWEPEYPHDKNTDQGGYGHIPANFYSSFDWRELSIEYKPSFSHSIRFGRQIINWGEAISGRVVDQCNPVDSRYLLGFTNLEETYMPLWMFRGIHDFYNWNTSVEWVIAPIWQADRYEHARSMTSSGQRYGDGSTGTPWYRFAANPEGRVERLNGADMVLSYSSQAPTRIYGPPFDTMYHGSDLLAAYTGWEEGDPIEPLSRYWTAFLGLPAEAYPDKDAILFATEIPTTVYDYTDHNFKNTRWGFKTRHTIGELELGLSFFQGPDHTGYYHYRYKTGPYLIFERVVPRYNTYGIFGTYMFNWAIVQFEGAYKPGRLFHKPLFGITTHEARLNNVVEKDMMHTLLGFTREQMVPFLNKFTPLTFRTQWQAQWYLDDMDDVAEVVTYFNETPQVNHEFLLSISTTYSYRKYAPSLTLVANPRGQIYTSASFGWVVDGFNERLNVNIGYTNIWGANAYSTRTVFAAKNDLAVLTVQYSFY